MEEEINKFVRDICSVEWLKCHAKSEAKKRVQTLLKQQLEAVKVWAEEKEDTFGDIRVKDLTQNIDKVIKEYDPKISIPK